MSKETFKEKLKELGLDEDFLALTTMRFLQSGDEKKEIAAFNKAYRLFGLDDLKSSETDGNVLAAMGMTELMMTFHERRRLEEPTQEAEVIDDAHTGLHQDSPDQVV